MTDTADREGESRREGRQTEMAAGGSGDATPWPHDFDLEDSCQKQ